MSALSFSRLLMPCIVGLFAFACADDDDDDTGASGGMAGAEAGGSSGSAATGGGGTSSSGTGGTGGTSGTSGAGGDAGAGQAGSVATGGSSGAAGGGSELSLEEACAKICADQASLDCAHEQCQLSCVVTADPVEFTAYPEEYLAMIRCQAENLTADDYVCLDMGPEMGNIVWPAPVQTSVCEPQVCGWTCPDQSYGHWIVYQRCGCT